MLVDIYVSEKEGSQKNRDVRIPWLPEKINYESGGTIRATYDILDKGPVEVPTGSGLCKYSWKSTFPGKYRTDKSMLRGEWKSPSYYHDIFEYWKTTGTLLSLMVIGYPFNTDVYLADYKGTPTGAFGDIDYDVSFVLARDISIESTTTTEETPKRATSDNDTHKVAPGDTLWKIAQLKLGKGSRHTEIYTLNKDIIEETAKKHGYKRSNNGHWIFPSTVLQLPAK